MGIRKVSSGAVRAVLISAAVGLAACGGGGGGSSAPAGGTPPPLSSEPPIVASPLQAQSVAAGAGVTFSVSSANATSFRWQSSVDDGAGWTDVRGATTSSLTLPRVLLADTATQYRVVLGNANGETVSAAAALHVRPNLRLLAGALGGEGFRDGSAAESRLRWPRGVAADSAGNVYVADGGNHAIRRLAADGTLTTIAGTPGVFGRADGPAASATFNNPGSIAVDANGVVWVMDQNNCLLRRVSGGQASTFADLGSANCYRGGELDGLKFGPSDIAIAIDGAILVSDVNRSVVRRIDQAGIVSVFAGMEATRGTDDGPRLGARFNQPRGLAIDALGTVYVAEVGNHTIRKIAPGGEVTTLAGMPGERASLDGIGQAARFAGPSGLALAGNRLIVSDPAANSIRQIDLTSAAVTTLAGAPLSAGSADGEGSVATFYSPLSVAVDAAGIVFVADTNNSLIRRISLAGAVITVAGQVNPIGTNDGTGGSARFRRANQIASDAEGNLYSGERYGTTVRKITPAGVVVTIAGLVGASGQVDGVGTSARFETTEYVAMTSDGNVYVADGYGVSTCLIRRVSSMGEVRTFAGRDLCGWRDGSIAIANMDVASGMAAHPSGVVAAAEGELRGGCRIRRIADGIVSTWAGNRACVVEDGPPTTAKIGLPHALAFEASGALLFADLGPTVRRLRPDGSIETIAGAAEAGNLDGVGTAARFQEVTALAVDAAGRIYVVDSGNHSVRVIAPGGRVRTVIPLRVGPRVVLGEDGSLNAPAGIAVLPSGEIAITSEFAVLVD